MNFPAKQTFIRTAASFAIVVTTYYAYAFAVVPWIEPIARAHSGSSGPSETSASSEPEYYQRLFKKFFPADSWVRRHPKMLESDQGMLLIDEYKNLGDGKIELTPFAMIFFPSQEVKNDPRRAGEAIVMESPQAILQFDKPLDLSLAKIGNLNSGQLLGQVVIRSQQKQPTPDDDLHITTSNVRLGEDRIYTDARVDFRLGPNFGGGRKMTIRLLPKTDAKMAGRHGPNIGGIGSFELAEEVRMQFQIGGRGLLPSSSERSSSQPAANSRKQPPLQITSTGPFRFDFVKNVATFNDQVSARRINPSGKSDQLACELLAIHFASKEKETLADPSDKRSNRAMPLGALQARRLVATGNPVVVSSPSTGASARCKQLDYDLLTGKIILQDARRVMLRYRTSTIQAPKVSYQPGESGKLGLIEATGPGQLHGSVEGKPDQQYQANWQQELRLRPNDGRQLLSLIGGARFSYGQIGSLSSREIWLWLTEMPKDKNNTENTVRKNATPNNNRPSQFDNVNIRPNRMLALGDVLIESPQLTGDPYRFEVWFQHAPPMTPAELAEAGTSLAPDPRSSRERPSRKSPSRSGQSQRRFQVSGQLLQINVLMRGRKAELQDVNLSGRARLSETQTASPDEQPLLVIADEVQLFDANSDATRVKVIGNLARVQARGLLMQGNTINLDRGENRLWIDGPGSMSILADRDLQGQKLGQKQKIDVDWQRGMTFDGQQIDFTGHVKAAGPSQRLSTEALQVYLDRRLDFNRPSHRRDQIRLHRLACQGGVLLENRTSAPDFQGRMRVQSIDRITAKNLEVNHLTGKITAQGPGFLKSVHRGSVGRQPSPVSSARRDELQQQPDPKNQLNYLEVIYQREITGNLLDRELVFTDQVRGIRGPVDDWNGSIDPDNPAGLGPSDVSIACDRLTITQAGARQSARRQDGRSAEKSRGPIELEALGNTLVEGSSFTARAHRITFAEAKDLLVLEGTGRSDARLWRQTGPGAPATQAAARKILYWRSTNRVEVNDAKYLNLGQLRPPNQPK